MNEVWSMDSPGHSSCLDGFSFPPTSLAGLPTAVVRGGTSISTTDPAPIFAPSPIFTFPNMVAPAPIRTPSPIFGCRSPDAFPVPPRVTWCKIDTLLPTTAVSPMTTPVAWSNKIPFPIFAAGCISTAKTSEIRECNANASGLRDWVHNLCATRWAYNNTNFLDIIKRKIQWSSIFYSYEQQTMLYTNSIYNIQLTTRKSVFLFINLKSNV